MEENIRALKTSLFGFNRNQVLALIDEQMKKNLEVEEQCKADLARMQEEKDKLFEEKRDLSDKAESLRASLDEKNKLAESLQQRVEEMTVSLRRSQADANDYKQRLFLREQEFLSLKKTRIALEEEKKGLQEKLAAVEEQCAALQEHAAELERRTQTLAADASDAQTKIDSLTRENEATREEADQARQELSGLKDSYIRRINQLTAAHAGELAHARRDLDDRVEDAERRAADAEQKLTGLREEMEIRLQEAHHTAFEQTAAQSERLRRDARALDDGIAGLRQRLNDVDNHITQAVSDLQTATNAISAVLDSAEAQARQLEGQLKRLASMQAAERVIATEKAEEAPAPKAAAPKAAPSAPKAAPVARPVTAHRMSRPTTLYARNLLERINRLRGE